jgi:hypothetical protein
MRSPVKINYFFRFSVVNCPEKCLKLKKFIKMVKKCQKNDFLILDKNGFIKSNKNFNKRVQKIKENHFLIQFSLLIFFKDKKKSDDFFSLGHSQHLPKKLSKKGHFWQKKGPLRFLSNFYLILYTSNRCLRKKIFHTPLDTF